MATPNKYIQNLRRTLRGTPLAPHAALIARVEAKNKLPAGIIAAIARAETSYGTAGAGPSKYNAWGWMTGAGPPNQRGFTNWQQAIRQYGKFLSQNYVSRGLNTPEKIESRYVGYTNSPWLSNVNDTLRQLGVLGSGPPSVSTPLKGPKGNKNQPVADDKMNKLMLLMAMMAMKSGNSSDTMAAVGIISAMRRQTTPGSTLIEDGKPDGKTTPPRGAKMYNGKGLLLPPTISVTHDTSGLSGFPAHDFMARGGTPVYAPADGVIDPSRPYGWLPTQNP